VEGQGTGEGVQVSQIHIFERTTEIETAQKYIEIVYDRGKRDLPLKNHHCHIEIHAGKYDGRKVEVRLTGEPDVLETCKSGSGAT
jgi:hypothetical protein